MPIAQLTSLLVRPLLCLLQIALKASRLACERLPSNADVWLERIQLEAQLNHGRQAAVMKQALQSVSPAKAPELWIKVRSGHLLCIALRQPAEQCQQKVHYPHDYDYVVLLVYTSINSTHARMVAVQTFGPLSQMPHAVRCPHGLLTSLCMHVACMWPVQTLCNLAILCHTTDMCVMQVLHSCTSSSPDELQHLQDMLLAALLGAQKGPVSGGMGEVAGSFLQASWRLHGPEAARKLFDQLLRLPPAGGDMFRAMLQLEQQQLLQPSANGSSTAAQQHDADTSKQPSPSADLQRGQSHVDNKLQLPASMANDAPVTASQGRVVSVESSRQHVRKVFEAAVNAYGNVDHTLWMEYARSEQQHSHHGAGDIYWRATKALADPEPFVLEYRNSLGL